MWILYSDVDCIHAKLNVIVALSALNSALIIYHILQLKKS